MFSGTSFTLCSIVLSSVLLELVAKNNKAYQENCIDDRCNSTFHYMNAHLVDVVLNITEIMSWKQLVIIYDDDGVDLLLAITHKVETENTYTKAAVFNIADWSGDDKSLLLTISNSYFPNISIVLLGGQRALQLLSLANGIDSVSNRRTDYRHKSKWVVIPANGSRVYSALNISKIILENIVLITCSGSSYNTFTLFNKQFIRLSVTTKDTLYPNVKYVFNGRHFLVASHASPGFYRKSTINETVTYTGYAKTFTDAMALFLNFTYTFVEPEDNQWGSYVNGTWDGLVGQLLRREVDMTVADLTATEDRETACDFLTPPFLTAGLGMVFKKGDPTSRGWLDILQPLQSQVYYTIIGGVACFTLVMYSMEKMNPFNRKIERHKSTTKEILGLSNLFISLFGCVCMGGDGIRPGTHTGRLLAFAVWLFCIVMAATYSGNLTASLSAPKYEEPFSTLAEMVDLVDWKWGVRSSTLSETILKNSPRPDMQKAWRKILEFNQTHPFVLSSNPEEHIDHVLSENYAYITLDPLLYKLRRKDCLLEIVSNVVSSQHVALAVSENSPFKPEIQRFLFYLFESGVLKLWEQFRYKDNRPRECLHTKQLRAMYLEDVKGAFAALGLGVALAFGVLVAENIHKMISK